MTSWTENAARPLDAPAKSWVDRLPAVAADYARLARLDRPTGAWLLFWPGAWGLALAATVDPSTPWWPDPRLLGLFLLGSFVMRSAGCAWNDIVDKDLDAQVARTAGRPLAAGRITRKAALLFVAGLHAVGLLILLQLSPLAIGLGFASIGLVALYPLMKRITWWPQAWLGLTFNWGALMGYAAAAGALNWGAGALYLAGFFWTLGYDTIYACQDIEDDALAGVKSSARRLGSAGAIKLFVAACFLFTTILLGGAAFLSEPAGRDTVVTVALVGAAIMGAFMTALMARADLREPKTALRLFKQHQLFGGAPFVFFVLSALVAHG